MTIDAHGGLTAQTTDGLTDYHVVDGYRMLSDAHTKQTDKEVAANLTLRYLPTKNLELGGLLSWQMLWPDNATDGLTNYPTLSFPSEAVSC